MEARSSTFAHYWRNCVADARMHTGSLKEKDLGSFVEVDSNTLETGQLPRDAVDRLFRGASQEVAQIDVVFRPWLYELQMEHGLQRNNGVPELVTPICTRARLSRDGRVYPQAATVIPRDLLEPMERKSFAIGTVDDLDAYLTTHQLKTIDAIIGENPNEADTARFRREWTEYLNDCRGLLNEVAGGFPNNQVRFLLRAHGLLNAADAPSAITKRIVALYDHMREAAVQVPLFETYARENVNEPEACLPSHAGFTGRLAHSSDRFSLADAQRDALSHLLEMRRGEILAVNGPPGTGKTTLLLSVVATLWTRAALHGGEPPVIVATSTNNQAVTNVIDAFQKDFSHGAGSLAGRWLPGLKSFAAYFPSTRKEISASEQYQTRTFFDAIESYDYLEQAEAAYVAAGRAAFSSMPKVDVEAIVAKLNEALQHEAGKLNAIESSWLILEQARASECNELGMDSAKAVADRVAEANTCESNLQQCERMLAEWEIWCAHEPIWYALFAWLRPVARKRLRLARIFLKNFTPQNGTEPEWTSLDHIEFNIRRWQSAARGAADLARQRLERAEYLLSATKQALHAWAEALRPLNLQGKVEDLKLSDVDAHADTQIRFKAFMLANHYWEGRWLLEMKELGADLHEEPRRNGRVAVQKRWRRRMKLCPCVVSTFFMLPQLMQVSKHVGSDQFEPDYLYDFIDLLIVDEAGQALPEIAGASFALAQKSLVIGDTLQIEPIWSIPPKVDIGNLIDLGLLRKHDYALAYERLCELGKTAARGNVMRIAQQASRYHYDPDLARGLFLYEHRRCYDEIIGYCNDLCYQGKLRPKRGTKPAKDSGLPALGYLHIDGMSAMAGGSRENHLEAETVAAWIKHHKAELLSSYDSKSLKDVVGVITPFSGQVAAIARACEGEGITVGGEDGITIGTVHSLQGAERPIVIFSSVYSKHGDGIFIDRRTSMLNVAVSRAKDSFLVFGDMDVFESVPRSKPRGLLASRLFRKPDNALRFESFPRPDLKTAGAGITTLRDAAEHDAFLLQLFDEARNEVHVVTPWIILERIHEIGGMRAMQRATERGVQVRVYTDPGWVTRGVEDAKKKVEWQRLREVEGELRKVGVQLLFVNRVHSKSVTGDNRVYCNGSFNWFSARRDGYANHETSFVYRGPALEREIKALISSLQQRVIRFQHSPTD